MEKPVRKPLTGREFYALLVLVLAANMVLWLDSFDRYLSSRYHFYLSEYLPESAYVPSSRVQDWLALNQDSPEQTAAAGGAGGAADAAVDADDAVVPAKPSAVAASAPAVTLAASAPGVVSVPGVARVPEPASAPGVDYASVGAASAPVRAMPGDVAAASAPVQAQAASAPAATGTQGAAQVALGESAPKVLFAGDSMMQGVAPIVISRMRRAFPQGLFVDASKESTGLTVNRYFDWPSKIKDECIKQGLRTVVIFLGPNDPWDIYERRKRYVFPSDDWQRKYRSRVDEVLDFAAAQRLRVIWIGLPVMREDRIEKGAQIENKIFQEETRKYRVEYLPTEDLLGSVDQPYKKYIEDPRKGKVVVRADDGVHFTSVGLRMISSRVEALLKKQDKL